MSSSYAVENGAALKILLHAAKYPHAAVNGVLLGSTSRDGSSEGRTTIADAVPLFHSFLSLAPMLETALVQVDAYAREQDLRIVGYYHANELASDLDLGPVARKIADRVYQQNTEACVLLLDNVKFGYLAAGKAAEVMQLYVRDAGRGWHRAAAPSPSPGLDSGDAPPRGRCLAPQGAGLGGLFLDLFERGRHRRLADFDEHLNNVARDWTNAGLLS